MISSFHFHARALATAWLLAALAGCANPFVGPGAEAAKRPNVVLILADDLGWAELGCYGQSKIRTPRLDELAAQGARFTDFYTGSPVCAPARCTLLTGLHTGHAYLRDNDEMSERADVWNDPALEGQRPLRAQDLTIGELFQEAGYATACIGKWGLGWAGSEGDPNLQGFDHSFGYLCQRVAHNFYPAHLWRNGSKVPLDNPTFRANQQLPADADPHDPASYASYSGKDYSHDLLTEEALGWIRRQSEQPFFLYLPYTIPHLALQVPEDSLAEYAGAFPESPYVGGNGYLPHRTPRAAYAAMITRLDRDVGRIVDLLAELSLESDTLIIFTSDNGASWVGGVDREFFDSHGGLRGRKAQLWEGGIRVPMIARWPGVIPAGSVINLPAYVPDFLPTFCEAAGLRTPPGSDGVSLLPTLRGAEAGETLRYRPLYWEFQGDQALRLGDWKLIRPGREGADQLYHLGKDPGESKDLAPEMPDLVAALATGLDVYHVDSALFPLR
jgi:arylsulfatase A